MTAVFGYAPHEEDRPGPRRSPGKRGATVRAKLSPAADKNEPSGTMTCRRTFASEAALIALFQGKRRCNVTFVLDSSETMRAVLGSAKRLLIQTLLTKASLRDSLFNIVTFSGKVNCWAHHMMPCAPDTVYSALSWIHSISCNPGRDLLAALSVALSDQACQAIHVLLMDLPDQPEVVLRALPALAAGRPVNVFYLQDSLGRLTSSTRSYLQHLTQTTRGSCCVISVGVNGELEQVIPLCDAGVHSSVGPLSCCCSSTSLMNASSPLLGCSLGNSLCSPTSCVLPGQMLSSSGFFPGCRVLARREVDGFYYLGSLIQQVQGCTGVWVVEFDPPSRFSLGVVPSQRQLVCSLDMVNHIRVHTHCLVPGDIVLSPWEPDLRRYGPGRVIAFPECRDGFGVILSPLPAVDGVSSLRVLMWNGSVSLVPASLVLPISASHHDRLVRELQLPASIAHQHGNCPLSRSVSCPPQLLCTHCRQPSSCCCSVTNPWAWVPPRSSGSSPERTNGFKKEEQVLQKDLENTDVRKSDPDVPSSPSSSISDNETRAMYPPAVKLRRKQRPPWKY